MDKSFFDFLSNSLKVVTENADPRTRVFAYTVAVAVGLGGLYLLTTPSNAKVSSETGSDDTKNAIDSNTSDEE